MASDIERHEQLQIASALNVASEIAHRYRLSSLQPLIQSGRQLAERDELSVAVILVRISPSRTPYLILGIEIPDWDLKELHMSYSVPKLIQVE